MNMKKNIFIALFAMFALITSAQSNYSNYLNKALEKLEAGDCESAQKHYDLYRELSGEVKNSVQVMIDDCQKTRIKKYSLGESIVFNRHLYRVAWLTNNQEHGLAVANYGSGSARQVSSTEMYYYHSGHLITLDELEKIIPNKNAIQISGLYWTSTIAKETSNWSTTKLWVVDVESKLTREVKRSGDGKYYKLLYVIEF